MSWKMYSLLSAALMLGANSLSAQHLGAAAAFEENKGQIVDWTGNVSRAVRYHYAQAGLQVYAMSNGLAYQFSRLHYPAGYTHKKSSELTAAEREEQRRLRAEIRRETYRMDVELVGADASARVSAQGKSEDYVNYYNHNALDVHSYERLTYHNVYPNIDWVIYSTANGLKYDFVVRPGGNPQNIRLRMKHQEGLQLNADGSLTLHSRMGDITEKTPVSLQNGATIATRFVSVGENEIAFQVGAYDPTQTLTIDPELAWSTYYGGAEWDAAYDVSGDGSNVYITGYTDSPTAIAQGGHQNTYADGNGDAMLVKFNSNGVRQWATYYGGADYEDAYAVDTDASGNVYIAGTVEATSGSGLSTAGAHQTAYAGSGSDAFLVKFNNAGTRQWATYYGGSDGYETIGNLEVDALGNVLIAGQTTSTNGIASSGAHQTTLAGFDDMYLAKFNSSGVRQWGTYYGGSSNDGSFSGMTLDASGNAYIFSRTQSTAGIATAGAYIASNSGIRMCLSKFNSDGTQAWGTYYDEGYTFTGIYVATDGRVYITANGASPATELAARIKFDASGNHINRHNYPFGISLNAITGSGNGNMFLVGRVDTVINSIIVTTDALQNNLMGGSDMVMMSVDTGGIVRWGSYYGSTSNEVLTTAHYQDNAWYVVAGNITHTALTTTAGAHQSASGGVRDAFLMKISEIAISIERNAANEPTLGAQAFPNPTQGAMVVELADAALWGAELDLRMVDLAGRVVDARRVQAQARMEMQLDYPAGTYFLTLRAADGRTTTLKIVKQ